MTVYLPVCVCMVVWETTHTTPYDLRNINEYIQQRRKSTLETEKERPRDPFPFLRLIPFFSIEREKSSQSLSEQNIRHTKTRILQNQPAILVSASVILQSFSICVFVVVVSEHNKYDEVGKKP